MKYLIINLSALVLSVVIISCSDIEQNISPAPEIDTHGSGVFNPSSSNYHGKLVLDSPNKLNDCQRCHAADFSGGITEIGCNTSNCHPTIGVHKEGITNPVSENFHAKFLKNTGNEMTKCSQCHGADFTGGLASPACSDCHSGISVHKEGITNPASQNFHGKFIAAKNWNLDECAQCHNSDYSGGLVSSSCLTCHNQAEGPEACNTCHGDFNNPTKIAPPRALNSSIETTYAGVGAHTTHLYDNNLGSEILCSTCHKVPQTFSEIGHIGDDGKAELNFGRLSIQGGANPNYSFTNNTCSDTYCHGNFTFYKDSASSFYAFAYSAATMVGNNVAVKWNQVDGTQAECGSCHGLPPVGHTPYALSDCGGCHTGIVDAQGNIIDKTKHINGVKNVFNN